MTNKDVLRTAMRQSAIDSGCRPEDFAGLENVVVRSCAAPGARRYLELPFFCDLGGLCFPGNSGAGARIHKRPHAGAVL